MERSTIDQRYSSDVSNQERDIPSFIEPRPPLILNPFMRPRPQKGTNLLELFEEDDSVEEVPDLVQVYLRLKPSNVPSSLYEVRSDQCLITSVDTATAGHGRRTQHNVCKMYSFSHIFGPDANQKEIFEHVVKGNLRKLSDGHSFTLLTYGASGSGKTYTLMGTVKAPGLVPRSLEYVFKVVEAAQTPLYRPGESKANKLSYAEQEFELQWVRNLRHLSAPLREKYRRMSSRLCSDMSRSTANLSNRTKHYVWVSFVEIYNEAIYDLLVTTERTAASKLRIREDPSGNVYVKGATQAFVRTGEEAYDVMVAGKHNLQVHATGVHAQSSRSHCIFTITMLTETECGVRAAHVRLCDLAGSERARRTNNVGARMQESRAINSSLHVLERCLHTLRRKQTAKQDMVPYRESKLTRLLGTGLSGTRGEAVSMVVTLNPAPEYAHETRHVLQLAAVARDIQVNNTIAESISTLESTLSQDTTITSSEEVTRLRAENERLHYELVQADSLNRKLMQDMEGQQQENAVTMKELVDEAKDITEQFYKSQLRSLEERHEAEMAELREEHEAKLARHVVADEGTPSRALQNKVHQLMKQIAILEEELNAERLARARMNEEMLHLRACIEERDEKASKEQDDAIIVTDSEEDSDEEDYLCNDSLEPTFKKEDINRSRLLRQSTVNTSMDKTHDEIIIEKDFTDNNLSKLLRQSTVNETYDINYSVTGNDDDDQSKRGNTTITDETYDVSNNDSNNDTYNQSIDCPSTVKKADVKDNFGKQAKANFDSSEDGKRCTRETSFVSHSDISANADIKESKNSDTGHLADVSSSMREDEELQDFSIIGDIVQPVKTIETQVDEIKKFALSTVSESNSLKQFEMLEMKINKEEKSTFKYFGDEKHEKSILRPWKKDNKPYFDDTQPSSSKIPIVKDLIKKQDVLRSPSIVQDEIPENYKPTTINKIMRESFTVNSDVPLAVCKNKMLNKIHYSIDLFEEVDSPDRNKLDLLKKVEKTRKSIANVSLVNKETETTSEIIENVDDDDKDEILENYKPTTINKIMRESFTVNSDVPLAVCKNKMLNKIHGSIDLFEEVDSPDLNKLDLLKKVEETRKSIANVSLVNKETETTSEIIENVDDNAEKSEMIAEIVATKVNSKMVDEFVQTEVNEDASQHVIKSEVTKDIVKNDVITVLAEEVKTLNGKDLDVPLELKEKSFSETTDKPTFQNESILAEAKPEQSTSEDVGRDIGKELKIDDPACEITTLNDITYSNLTMASDNTIDAFENIYKGISAPRPTDFELLIPDKSVDTANESQIKNIEDAINLDSKQETSKIDKDHKVKETVNEYLVEHSNNDNIVTDDKTEAPESKNIKYNLRHKPQGSSKADSDNDVTIEHTEKRAPRTAKKNLRLRRKNKVDEPMDDEVKLKDIVNLQKEFSDVTLGLPAPVKVVEDMPSPGKSDENQAPLMGAQSCPSKSVTRSRRKLFTPRAEPLDESPPSSPSTSAAASERVRVPRPSYHKTRTRRRLN